MIKNKSSLLVKHQITFELDLVKIVDLIEESSKNLVLTKIAIKKDSFLKFISKNKLLSSLDYLKKINCITYKYEEESFQVTIKNDFKELRRYFFEKREEIFNSIQSSDLARFWKIIRKINSEINYTNQITLYDHQFWHEELRSYGEYLNILLETNIIDSYSDAIITEICSRIPNEHPFSSNACTDVLIHEVTINRNNFQKFFPIFKKISESMTVTDNKEKPVLEIQYIPETNIIKLNNKKQIKSYNWDSDNEKIFRVIYEYPNTELNETFINNNIDSKNLSIDFNKFVHSSGFTGKLRTIFFKTSQTKIIFFNPIYQIRLESLEITRLDIKKILKN